MSNITISTFQVANSNQYTGTVTLRIWFVNCAGPHFLDSLNNTVMCGTGADGSFYEEVAVSVSSGTLTIPAFILPSTDDSNNLAVRAHGRFYVNGAARDWLFQNYIIPNGLGTPLPWPELVDFNLVATSVPAGGTDTFLSQIIALINTAVGTLNDASTTVKGRTKLSSDGIASDPTAIGDNDPRVGVDSADHASLSAAVASIGATAKTLIITTALPSGATVVVPATLTLQFAQGGSIVLGAGHTVTVNSDTSKWPDAVIFSGTGSLALASPVVRASWFTGDLSQKIVAALAVINTTTGGTVDARMFRGAQTGSVPVVIGTKNTTVLLGPVQLAMGTNQWIVTKGKDGCAIIGASPWSGLPIDGSTLTGTVIHYTGTSDGVKVGDNTEHTENFRMSDVAVVTDDAGVNVVAIHLFSTVAGLLERVKVVNRSLMGNGAGIVVTGGATDQSYSAYNMLMQCVADNYLRGMVLRSTVSNVNCNVNQIIGGRIGGAFAPPTVEGYGVDIQCGLSNSVRDIDIENVNIGLKINSPSNYGSNVNFEGVGTSATATLPGNAVVFTADASNCHVDFSFVSPGSGNTFISDSGTMNTWNWRSFGPVLQSGDVPVQMTTAQRDTLPAPRDGTRIYNTTTSKLQVRSGGAWVDLH